MNDSRESSNRPTLLVIAGPNGSGKTTVAEFLATTGSLGRYLNADLIARGLEARSHQGGRIESGRIMLNRLHQAIQERESLSFESTLSGRSWIKLLESAKNQGFEVTICYVIVPSVELCIQRVEQRVREGGHAIGAADLRRRYMRSLSLFFNSYSVMADNWYFFDNSENSAVLLACKENPASAKIFKPEQWKFYERLGTKN